MNYIAAVRPHRLSISDKYSANLYRYVKKWQGWGIGAYVCDRSVMGEAEPFDYSDPNAGRIVIGRKDEDGWLSGSRLGTILTSKNAERWAFTPRDAAHYHDATDWFWPEYVRIGRALWDAKGTMSMVGDGARWEYLDKTTRRCAWSGRVYKSHTEIIKRDPIVRTVWTEAANDNAATDTQVSAAA